MLSNKNFLLLVVSVVGAATFFQNMKSELIPCSRTPSPSPLCTCPDVDGQSVPGSIQCGLPGTMEAFYDTVSRKIICDHADPSMRTGSSSFVARISCPTACPPCSDSNRAKSCDGGKKCLNISFAPNTPPTQVCATISPPYASSWTFPMCLKSCSATPAPHPDCTCPSVNGVVAAPFTRCPPNSGLFVSIPPGPYANTPLCYADINSTTPIANPTPCPISCSSPGGRENEISCGGACCWNGVSLSASITQNSCRGGKRLVCSPTEGPLCVNPDGSRAESVSCPPEPEITIGECRLDGESHKARCPAVNGVTKTITQNSCAEGKRLVCDPDLRSNPRCVNTDGTGATPKCPTACSLCLNGQEKTCRQGHCIKFNGTDGCYGVNGQKKDVAPRCP